MTPLALPAKKVAALLAGVMGVMADHAELRDVLSRQFQSWNSRLQAVLRLSDPAVAARDAALVGQSIVTLTACKKLAALVPGLPTWCSALAGRDAVSLERHSLLGPLLRLGAGPDSSVSILPQSDLSTCCLRTVIPQPLFAARAFPSLEVVSLAAFADYRNARRQEFHPVEVSSSPVASIRAHARPGLCRTWSIRSPSVSCALMLARRLCPTLRLSPPSTSAVLRLSPIIRPSRRRRSSATSICCSCASRTPSSTSSSFTQVRVLCFWRDLLLTRVIFGAQLPKVQAEYYDLFAALRVDLGDETRIGDEPAVQSSQAETPHFVSDVLFLGAYFAHVALLPTIRQRSRALDEGERLQQEYARVDSGVHWRGVSPPLMYLVALARLTVSFGCRRRSTRSSSLPLLSSK